MSKDLYVTFFLFEVKNSRPKNGPTYLRNVFLSLGDNEIDFKGFPFAFLLIVFLLSWRVRWGIESEGGIMRTQRIHLSLSPDVGKTLKTTKGFSQFLCILSHKNIIMSKYHRMIITVSFSYSGQSLKRLSSFFSTVPKLVCGFGVDGNFMTFG